MSQLIKIANHIINDVAQKLGITIPENKLPKLQNWLIRKAESFVIKNNKTLNINNYLYNKTAQKLKTTSRTFKK